eukprot:COSAG05_NODE_608_length_8372_cov_2.996615_9_plen_137_part_00
MASPGTFEVAGSQASANPMYSPDIDEDTEQQQKKEAKMQNDEDTIEDTEQQQKKGSNNVITAPQGKLAADKVTHSLHQLVVQVTLSPDTASLGKLRWISGSFVLLALQICVIAATYLGAAAPNCESSAQCGLGEYC